ncbi:MAG: epoxyqueuosine reductase [Deltaproteobacteria bacterium]|nr:epoxyqueuosine reductase [Deltaproteobacteria bacterium]
MKEATEELKKLFTKNNIPVFGISKASSLENEPSGYSPSDMLSSAESILCIGIPVPKGIFNSGERSGWMYWRAANIYYRNIDMVLMRAASIIEEKGETAVPVYGCFPYDIKGKGDFLGYLSLVRMGEAAGIGKVGKNGLLFNSKYGSRLLLGGIITTAKMPFTAPPKKGEKGCPKECFACQEQCPVGAIDKTGKVNGPLCTKYSSKSPMFSYFMKQEQNSAEDIKMLNHLTAVDDHSMYQCIKCVSVCPYQ